MTERPTDYSDLAEAIKAEGHALGFSRVGITDADLGEHEAHLSRWLADGFHGEMSYMASHGRKRSRPADLLPGTHRVIAVRMDYLGEEPRISETLAETGKAYVSRYALGRDYHKVIRSRLGKLVRFIESNLQEPDADHFIARAFTDSAPVLEKALAEKAGLGWIGKNTLLLSREAGSWFFLGEIYTNLPLPVDPPTATGHCGSCTACLDVCPTDAFAGPYRLDARKCISYLTIELREAIPEPLREPMGNRVFGCDDCQVVCPWNRYAVTTREKDFSPRHGLDDSELLTLFNWDEETFLSNTAGSAIRRTGYRGWLRNLSVGLGNAGYDPAIEAALTRRLAESGDAMLREHFDWALARQVMKKSLR